MGVVEAPAGRRLREVLFQGKTLEQGLKEVRWEPRGPLGKGILGEGRAGAAPLARPRICKKTVESNEPGDEARKERRLQGGDAALVRNPGRRGAGKKGAGPRLASPSPRPQGQQAPCTEPT